MNIKQQIFDFFTQLPYHIFMKEMTSHWPGRFYLISLLLSVVALLIFLAMGGTTTMEGAEPFLLFGWITMPLLVGIVFVTFWLVTYIVYFFFFWPYR